MGGRGASSRSSSSLPNGAVAMRVKMSSGLTNVYHENSNGNVVTSPDVTLSTPRLVNTDKSLRQLYDTAKNNGYEVTLYSKSDVSKARKDFAENSRANARIIAQGEVKGTAQSRRISSQDGRIRTQRRGR